MGGRARHSPIFALALRRGQRAGDQRASCATEITKWLRVGATCACIASLLTPPAPRPTYAKRGERSNATHDMCPPA